ncbi:MAG TPA: T9SS type A sorting domain-containing protein, partial [Bacteroidales bacterium]|nr:T9SS type A sorting domain-containing protein [Bacteroidales bacterium]
GFNAAQMFGSVGQVGSKALFDDVNLTDVSGLPLQFIPSVKVKLSPNPASQYMKIELGRSIENGYFEVYDAQAKFIRQHSINGNSGQISVSDLSTGTYYYKLTENKKLLNSGTFIVTR